MDAKTKWDQKYLDRLENLEKPIANTRLKELSPYLTGGKALDLACGLGANSLFLAENGYEVQAFDISDVAVDYVKKEAEEQGLAVYPRMVDLTDINSLEILDRMFDLIIITYYLDRAIFPFVKTIVMEKGYFFMETFYKSPSGEGKVSEHFKLHTGELLAEFRDWQILYYEENEHEGRQTIFARKR
ncbi:methyltransferase domain-containing protein [Anaerobacillus alkaliphilus]|uniref:methyltransferase domain-containing protein n=1 Tax=Anaerobacillus alkaliphilus TaxID=1548597 RepID=UPI0013755BA9|nr:methyltransferase domain-containing protein [Anaerobacillus alkaliphilus]